MESWFIAQSVWNFLIYGLFTVIYLDSMFVLL